MARGQPGRTGELEVVLQDVNSRQQQHRVTITASEGSWPRFVDTNSDFTLVLTATPSMTADQPRLTLGDEGAWVQLLQAKLSDHNMSNPDDPYLIPDGIFGPRTEAAVRALQTDSDLPVTGSSIPPPGSNYGRCRCTPTRSWSTPAGTRPASPRSRHAHPCSRPLDTAPPSPSRTDQLANHTHHSKPGRTPPHPPS